MVERRRVPSRSQRGRVGGSAAKRQVHPPVGFAAPSGHAHPYPWVRLRSGTSHPLIFQRMVGDVDPAAKAGDIVSVYDKAGRHFGHAFYHDRSQIALRMLSYDAPAIDDGFFRERLARAVEWRGRLVAAEGASQIAAGGRSYSAD